MTREKKLPYQIYLNKGYERYKRRRIFKKQNCNLKIEIKKRDENRKRGPRFKLTHEDRKQRGEIEKFIAWIKSFQILN